MRADASNRFLSEVEQIALPEKCCLHGIGTMTSCVLTRVLAVCAGLAAVVCVVLISQAEMSRPQELMNSYKDRILTRDGTIDLKYDEKVWLWPPSSILSPPILDLCEGDSSENRGIHIHTYTLHRF